MSTAAIYAPRPSANRYGVSIVNQISRCRRLAAKEGLVIADRFIYSDTALPSSSKTGPIGFNRQALFRSIASKQIDILFIETMACATQDIAQAMALTSFVENNNLRVVTCDGLDTSDSNWKLTWLTQLLEAAAHGKDTSLQVVRGMLGQLERGYQVSQPPFGFKTVRDRTPKGHELGSRWEIDSQEAEVILKMYRLRQSGKSVAEIALELNTAKVAPPCPSLWREVAYWRPSSVRRILANKIYKGIYAWNCSPQAKATAITAGRRLEEREFQRPHLQIVSDETWEACNPPKMDATTEVGEQK
jgi:site-specific DNA recombinase